MSRAGSPIRVLMSKWGNRPHWEFDAVVLGDDEHGTWLGCPSGTHHERPGMAYDSDVDTVTLIPREGWYAATLHAPGIWCDTYVDLATPADWDDRTLRMVDLDLDVIRMAPEPPKAPHPLASTRRSGEVFIDDEDEFADHRVRYGYPEDVIATTESTAAELVVAVREQRPPFDAVTRRRWLAEITRLSAVRRGTTGSGH